MCVLFNYNYKNTLYECWSHQTKHYSDTQANRHVMTIDCNHYLPLFTENNDDRCVTTPTPTLSPSSELCTFIWCHQVTKTSRIWIHPIYTYRLVVQYSQHYISAIIMGALKIATWFYLLFVDCLMCALFSAASICSTNPTTSSNANSATTSDNKSNNRSYCCWWC